VPLSRCLEGALYKSPVTLLYYLSIECLCDVALQLLRRTVHIPSAEEDAEDETKSTHSDKGPWGDEPSETNDSTTNEDLKMEEDLLPCVSYLLI